VLLFLRVLGSALRTDSSPSTNGGSINCDRGTEVLRFAEDVLRGVTDLLRPAATPADSFSVRFVVGFPAGITELLRGGISNWLNELPRNIMHPYCPLVTVVIFIGDYFLQDYFASGLAQAAHRFLMIEHSVVLDDLR
jgi:hypothetical protein